MSSRYRRCHKKSDCVYAHDEGYYRTRVTAEDWQRYLNFSEPVRVRVVPENRWMVVPIFWMVFVPKMRFFLDKSEVRFPHSAAVFFALQEFVGTGRCDVNAQNLVPILRAAKEYQVAGLKLLAANYLLSVLTEDNVLQVLSHAEEFMCHHFRAKIVQYILKHFPALSSRKDFLTNLPKTLFLEIAKSSFLNAKEDDLLAALVRWSLLGGSNLAGLPDVLRHVRCAALSKEVRRDLTLLDSKFYRDVSAEAQRATKEFRDVAWTVAKVCAASTVPPENGHFRVPREFVFSTGGFYISPLSKVESYDPRTKKWTPLPHAEMPQPHAYHGQAVSGHCLYTFGGYGKNTYHKTTHRLDLRTGSWSRVANLLLARCYVSAVALEGKVYALGGFDGVTRTRTVETFDPEGNKWEAAPSMRVIRSDACAFAFGKKIMIVGGFTGTSINSSTEILDTSSGTWTDGPSLSVPRSGCKSVVLGNTAYVIGGYDGQHRLSSVERLNLDFPSRWESCASLNVQRSNFGAATCEGRIVVGGGFDGQGVISSVETYCPLVDAWTLETERIGQAMSALNAITLTDDAVDTPLRYLVRPKSWRALES